MTVTPSVTGSADVTVSGALTFTAANWDRAQTVTVSAAQDADAANDAATVSHAVTGSDYGSVTAPEVAVTVEDDDERGIEVSATALTVPEGESRTYTVVLDCKRYRSPILPPNLISRLTLGLGKEPVRRHRDDGFVFATWPRDRRHLGRGIGV